MIHKFEDFITEAAIQDWLVEFALPKDKKRISDIKDKANGNSEKEISLATTMAKSIDSKDKALGRAEAAEEILGKDHPVTKIFYDRAKELGVDLGKAAAEKAKPKYIPGSLLPKDKQYVGYITKNKSKGRGSYRDCPILPCGSLNFMTGDNKYFNVPENGDGCVEIYKVSGGGPYGNTDGDKYRAVITAGKNPLHGIGDTEHFMHDQTQRPLFYGTMVDYINVQGLKELIALYGKSMPCYVYK